MLPLLHGARDITGKSKTNLENHGRIKTKKTILIIGLVLSLVFSAGCIPDANEEPTPTPTPTPTPVPMKAPPEDATPEDVSPAAETPASAPTIGFRLIYEHEKLFRETKDASDRGARPTRTVDKDGYLVTRWNYRGVRLDTVEKKRDDGHGWTTTAFRYGIPLITVHGRVHDRVGGDALRDAYEEIKRGDYDFTTNPVDVTFIRLFVQEVKKMNTSTLQGMLANPTISTNDLAVMVGEGKYVGFSGHPALVIGYTDTADPDDGNRIYAHLIQRYLSGVPSLAYYFDDPTAQK